MTKKKEPFEEQEKSEVEEETAEEAVAQPEKTIETLRAALETERQRAEEHLDRWKRSAADFANYRKRNDKERAELIKFSNAVLITRLLPILDDFERAFQTLPDEMRHFTWVEGIALVGRKLDAVLEQEGLKAIEARGNPFDPAFHQAITYEETTAYDDGVIMEEFQRGYTLNDRVLRPTLVKVAQQAAKAAQDETPEETGEEETAGQPPQG